MRDVFEKAFEINKHIADYRECVRLAVKELVPDDELREIYTIYGIDHNQYIDSVTKQYIKYRQNI